MLVYLLLQTITSVKLHKKILCCWNNNKRDKRYEKR